MLELVAGGRDDLKAMLGVSKSWQRAFESSVTSLKIGSKADHGLAMGAPFTKPFAERFLGLTSLSLFHSLMDEAELEQLVGLKRLRTLLLGGGGGETAVLRSTALAALGALGI